MAVDIIIILVLGAFLLEAFGYGFWGILINFISFLGSLLLSFRVYKFAAEFLRGTFDLSDSLNNAIGFIASALILEVVISLILSFFVEKLPRRLRESKFNTYLGILPAFGQGLVVISFLLTAIMALPVRPDVKKLVQESKIASYILEKSSGAERGINEVFGGAINEALTYLTIEPRSDETISLKNGIDNLSIDKASEAQMLILLNQERTSRGLSALTINEKAIVVAEDYARDMWERRYFSHYNPEGETVADRFDKAGIPYQAVGENLALSPTVQIAHAGLMNSEGHRANILEPRFKRVGIGVVDNGIYGKMFVQQFSD